MTLEERLKAIETAFDEYVENTGCGCCANYEDMMSAQDKLRELCNPEKN